MTYTAWRRLIRRLRIWRSISKCEKRVPSGARPNAVRPQRSGRHRMSKIVLFIKACGATLLVLFGVFFAVRIVMNFTTTHVPDGKGDFDLGPWGYERLEKEPIALWCQKWRSSSTPWRACSFDDFLFWEVAIPFYVLFWTPIGLVSFGIILSLMLNWPLHRPKLLRVAPRWHL